MKNWKLLAKRQLWALGEPLLTRLLVGGNCFWSSNITDLVGEIPTLRRNFSSLHLSGTWSLSSEGLCCASTLVCVGEMRRVFIIIIQKEGNFYLVPKSDKYWKTHPSFSWPRRVLACTCSFIPLVWIALATVCGSLFLLSRWVHGHQCLLMVTSQHPWTVELFMIVLYHDWPPKKMCIYHFPGLLAKIKCKNVYLFILR